MHGVIMIVSMMIPCVRTVMLIVCVYYMICVLLLYIIVLGCALDGKLCPEFEDDMIFYENCQKRTDEIIPVSRAFNYDVRFNGSFYYNESDVGLYGCCFKYHKINAPGQCSLLSINQFIINDLISPNCCIHMEYCNDNDTGICIENKLIYGKYFKDEEYILCENNNCNDTCVWNINNDIHTLGICLRNYPDTCQTILGNYTLKNHGWYASSGSLINIPDCNICDGSDTINPTQVPSKAPTVNPTSFPTSFVYVCVLTNMILFYFVL